MKRWGAAAILLCLLAMAADTSMALPRFSMRTGAKCASCHVNPSGGAMRQPFGATYGREELPVPTWADDFTIEDFSTVIANVMGVGADFRTLYLVRQRPDTGGTSASENAFWQMQGDIYLNFRIAKKINLFFKKGLYSGFEAYGLLNVLPASGHLKVGKFVPNYGMKLDDHTAFTRTYTGFSAELGRPELTGLEVGFAPGPVQITGGVFNATDGFGGSGGSSKAVLGRIETILPLKQDAIYLGLGANIFTYDRAGGGSVTYYGGIAGFGAGPFSLNGELDLLRTKTAAATVNGLVLYAEANYVLTPGVDLKVAYDFYDPDRDLKTGARARYSFGLEFFPIAGVEVRPMYRIMKEEPTDISNNEYHVLFHIYL